MSAGERGGVSERGNEGEREGVSERRSAEECLSSEGSRAVGEREIGQGYVRMDEREIGQGYVRKDEREIDQGYVRMDEREIDQGYVRKDERSGDDCGGGKRPSRDTVERGGAGLSADMSDGGGGEEIFDIYDADDRHIGTATRSDAHARGLWHHTFHCWLVRRGEDGRACVLFQRRSRDKDTNPGQYDITAAGHLAAGETVRDAVRELEEELGLRVSLEELTRLGTFREEDEGEAQGVRYIDREVSEVYGCATDWKPAAFRLQREEVAGLYEAEAGALLALMRGETETVLVAGVVLGETGEAVPVEGVRVSRDDFVARDPAYYIRVFEALGVLVES
ncbi:NUDIX hydrolase [Cohnella sp. 56]|uniref:NUDIX hydrolase n=1 Tax=Cohnella sp. 56 TaxID=3113722 RepID=UPI0030E8BAFE